jgi:hypothetical protein
MSRNRTEPPESALPAKGGLHIVRGNGRNMWDKPPGQKSTRLEPPTYETPGKA